MSDISVHHRACHLCEAICGLTIQTEGERILSIKGDHLDSFSRGHICPKAVALQDIQNDPDRLRHPMRRCGDEWQAISWEEAYELVAERLAEIRERHGSNAVAIYQGNPSVHNYGLTTHSNYFLGLLKTRNRFSATSVDQLPHHLTSHLMYGHGLLLPVPDIDHTDFMLILGGNPLASNGSIMTVPDVEKRLKAIRARGGKLVVVDPRRSETAAIADQHLFVRPGQDAALLFGLLNTLFEEGLTRASELPLDGIEEVRTAIAAFSAEAMSARCGVPAEQIRQLARDFAAADRAVCYGRMGVSTQAFGTLCQWLVQLINLVTGNLDRVGGALCTEPAVDLVETTKGGHFDAWRSRVSQLPEYGGELPVAALAEEMLEPGGMAGACADHRGRQPGAFHTQRAQAGAGAGWPGVHAQRGLLHQRDDPLCRCDPAADRTAGARPLRRDIQSARRAQRHPLQPAGAAQARGRAARLGNLYRPGRGLRRAGGRRAQADHAAATDDGPGAAPWALW